MLPARRTLGRDAYLLALGWAFAFFNSARMLAYLPTLWAIYRSGDSSQHSLWTWLTWLTANATMALWVYENNGRRCNRVAVVNALNCAMCLAAVLLILRYRL